MKLTSLLSLSVAAAMVTTSTASAQYGFRSQRPVGTQTAAQSTTPPWKQFYLNPNARVKLDFRNAGVDAVLHTISQASGIAIIKDPGLTGGITLQSPKQQTLGDAFSMLNAVLNLKNYAITKQDNFLLVSRRQAVASGGASAGSFNLQNIASMMGGRGNSTPSVRVYSIKYANATDLAKTINDVFATTTNNNINGSALVLPFTFPVAGQQQNNSQSDANATGFGGRGRRRGAGGFGAGGNAAGSGDETVKASADDFSNSLIVNAPPDMQSQISDLVAQIDRPSDQPQQSRVFPLQYAPASDLESVIQTVLSGTSPTGRGSTTAQANSQRTAGGGPGGFFGRIFGGGGGNSSTANGTVTSDARTNSLVVTSTIANLQQIATIVQTLDKPATYVSATFVYQMQNARADVIANLLNEAVGNRTTNGSVGGSLTNQLSQSSTSSSSSLSSSGITSSSNRAGSNNSNFQVTTSTQNSTPATSGVDENGHIVNIRNLTGQATFIPNVDTNSIVVVAAPEYRGVITRILQQMDSIPSQVMIEALIVEVNLTKADQFGVEYSITQNNPFGGLHGTIVGTQGFGLQKTIAANATGSPTTPTGGVVTFTAGQYNLFLQALKRDTTFNVLSTPRIFATNNATAQINVSQSVPYVSSTVTDITGTTQSYEFLNVGVVLTVTPLIKSDGFVTMDINQTANDLVGYIPIGTSSAPEVNQREATTTVSVKDGETVVLGGIIQNSLQQTVSKVPILGDIPVLGNLFRSNNKTNQKTELLVFLTPHIVKSAEDAAALREATEKELGTSTQKLLPTGTLPSTPKKNASENAAAGEEVSPTPHSLSGAPVPPAVNNPAPIVTAPIIIHQAPIQLTPNTGTATPNTDNGATVAPNADPNATNNTSTMITTTITQPGAAMITPANPPTTVTPGAPVPTPPNPNGAGTGAAPVPSGQ